MKTKSLNDNREPDFRIHFNLKQQKEQDKLTQIMLVMTINGQRIRVYTKLRIKPKYWDKSLNRCRLNQSVNLRERNKLVQINKYLDRLTLNILQADKKLADKGKYLSSNILRILIQELYTNESNATDPIAYLYKQVDNYLESINRRGKRGISSTQKTYQTALKRLENFCHHHKRKITSFEHFDKEFFSEFTYYLYTYNYQRNGEKKRYTQNTIINTIKVIKNLLHRAYDNEMTENNYFQKVQTILSSDTSELIYLNEKEIKKIAKVKVNDTSEKNIRDMFVIACYTALRISDIKRLNKAIFRDATIILYQAKTKEEVEIPILKEIAPLISYYQQHGFPSLDIGISNRTIKELARRSGIDSLMNCKENRGGEITVKTLPKWRMVSFHTARRSCITNLYKRGYPINYIMTLSGHRSVQACQRYMRASSKEVMHNFVTLLKKNQAL